MDRIYFITSSEEMARSLSGKIEILSSYGSFIRFDAICLGWNPNQKKSSILIPSQEMNPQSGENEEGKDSIE
jgi:5'(3')-deoxyribonucleotidase